MTANDTASTATPQANAADTRGNALRAEEATRAGRATNTRTIAGPILLAFGVLALQLGFILSYVGAFHNPTPHALPLAVVGPEAVTAPLAARLSAATGNTLSLTLVPDAAAANGLIDDRAVYGFLAPGQQGDQLTLADAAGTTATDALARIIGQVEAAGGRTLAVSHSHPLPASDSRGLAPFYLVLGWVVGGYLLPTAIGLIRGTRAATRGLTVVRLGGFALYALASGIGGVLLIENATDVLHGHAIALAALGTLIVFAVSAATSALQATLGLGGTGATIILFVILGNPSSGGPLAPELLPTFWRRIGQLLPPGAGTTAVRNLVYFDGRASGHAFLVLAAYAIVGALLTLGVGELRRALTRRGPAALAA